MANILDQITFGDGLLMMVDADPSASAGTPAFNPSIALVTGAGRVFLKTGSLDTAWTEVPTLATDLTGYLKLLGRAGGQTANGGTATSDNLTLSSTTDATKGKIIFGTASVFDEANNRWGFGTLTPATTLDITKSGTSMQFEVANGTSSNATPTTIGSIATTSGTSGLVRITWVGTDASNNSVTYEKMARYTNVAGTVTVSTVQSVYQSEAGTLAAASTNITATGANVTAQVTGIAATTITWKVIYQIFR